MKMNHNKNLRIIQIKNKYISTDDLNQKKKRTKNKVWKRRVLRFEEKQIR